MAKVARNNEIDKKALENVQGSASNWQNMINSQLAQVIEPVAKMSTIIAQLYSPPMAQYQQIAELLHNMMAPYEEIQTSIQNSLSAFAEIANKVSLPILNLHYENISTEEELEFNNANERIITEILQPDQEKKINVEESPIITLSPINDKVLKYLSENPEAFYQLTGNDFEIVMAEIYSKLGYDVTRTQTTRDGGKDIIIRKTELLGDFIYYVECKKYAPKRHIGMGIVRNLVGTVNTDRVNGGILATTSFFTEDARKFILDNKWNCQIKMHDYNVIQELLKNAVIYSTDPEGHGSNQHNKTTNNSESIII